MKRNVGEHAILLIYFMEMLMSLILFRCELTWFLCWTERISNLLVSLFHCFKALFTFSSFWVKRWLITLYFITVTVIFIMCKWIKSLINSRNWSTTLFTKYSNLLSCVLSRVVKTATHFSLLAFRILTKYFQINLWNKLT